MIRKIITTVGDDDESPVLERTNRECSTPCCAQSALFFPLVRLWPKSELMDKKKKTEPLVFELSLQFFPACRNRITAIEHFPIDMMPMAISVAKGFGQGEPDASTAKIEWIPLIVA